MDCWFGGFSRTVFKSCALPAQVGGFSHLRTFDVRKPPTHVHMPPKIGALGEVARDNMVGWILTAQDTCRNLMILVPCNLNTTSQGSVLLSPENGFRFTHWSPRVTLTPPTVDMSTYYVANFACTRMIPAFLVFPELNTVPVGCNLITHDSNYQEKNR